MAETTSSRLQRLASKILTAKVIVTTVIVLFLLTISFGNLYYRFAPARPAAKPCGSTPDEAIAAGCKFDVINFSWQRPECFFEEIHERYWKKAQEHGPLRLYADAEYTKISS